MKTTFDYTGGLETFQRAYKVCALWSTNDESNESGDQPLDLKFDVEDIAPGSAAVMDAECAAFVAGNLDLLTDWDAAQAGHDFWLTRNRHGAGFWDRGHSENGEALTRAAHAAGERDLYVGDDRQVWQS